MEERRGSGRLKRSKAIEEGYWDCSVCTYKNSPEAFKCDMCDIRKGTSTRKPRINAQLVAQQVAQQYAPPQKKEKNNNRKDRSSASPSTSSSNPNKKLRPPRLKNIDRSSATTMEVTVGNVTVIITDYKPKKERKTSTDSQNNNNNNTDSRDSTKSESPHDHMNGDLGMEDEV